MRVLLVKMYLISIKKGGKCVGMYTDGKTLYKAQRAKKDLSPYARNEARHHENMPISYSKTGV